MTKTVICVKWVDATRHTDVCSDRDTTPVINYSIGLDMGRRTYYKHSFIRVCPYYSQIKDDEFIDIPVVNVLNITQLGKVTVDRE